MLINKLFQDTKDSSRYDFDALIKVFAIFMQERKAIMSTTIEQLLSMSMAMGYFYRVFLEKNEVQKVGEVGEESINLSNDESSKESTN